MSLQNIVTEAGAGCGKTTNLVHAICDGLEAGHFAMENVVAITFTRLAAAELRTRIAFQLQERIRNGKPDLQVHLPAMAGAAIGTIHSFCARLLKERPLEALIDPAFQMLEDDSELFVDETFRRWLAQRLQRYGNFLRILNLEYGLKIHTPDYESFGNDDSFQGLLKQALRYRELHMYVPEHPGEVDDLIAALIKELEPIAQRVESEKLSALMLEQLKELRTLAAASPREATDGLRGFKPGLGNNGGGAEKENRDAWKEAIAQCAAVLPFALHYEQIRDLHASIAEAARDFIAFYEEELRVRGLMDHEDILHRTERLLKEHADVRVSFQKKFRYYFVDEFQDTDPVQVRILFYLNEDSSAKGKEPSDWTKISLAPGRLFVVGDPKQSIYRFRRADIEIYSDATERIAASKTGQHRPLNQNWRSRKKILDWVNAFFGPRIRKPADGSFQAEYADLEPSERTAPDGIVQFVEPDQGTDLGALVDEIREAEAKLTALKVESLIREGNHEPSDIMLIYRYTKNMQLTAAYLEQLGIECEIEAGSVYFGRTEVEDVINFLTAVENPLDTMRVFAALQGPFFSAGDPELLEWFNARKSAGEHSPFDYRFVSEDSTGYVAESLQQLAHLHTRSLEEPAHRILEERLQESGILSSYRATYQGQRRMLNVLKAVELLRGYGPIPFPEAIRALRSAYEENRAMPDYQPRGRESNAVRMLTIHRAKGLESPVVYLPDSTTPNTRYDTRPAPYFVDTERGRVVFWFFKGATSQEFRRLQRADQEREEAEAERLRYVATTRAKDVLLINRIEHPKTDKCFLTRFHPAPGTERGETFPIQNLERVVGVSLAKLPPRRDAKLAQAIEHARAHRDAAVEAVAKVTFASVSPSTVDSDGETEIRLELEISEDGGLSAIAQGTRRATLGTLAHRLLELDPPNVAECAGALVEQHGLDIAPKDLALLVEKVKQKEIMQEASKSTQVYRELPLSFRGADGVYYDGVVDLLFRGTDGWTLVDYKIVEADSEVRRKQLEQEYAGQMEAYAEGLKQMGIVVTRKVLVGP